MTKRLLLAAALAAALALPAAAAGDTWSFAVSGDSRDCGDVVMPKIARSVLDERGPSVDFYWHLGDFRRIYDIDCDILSTRHPGYDCVKRPTAALGREEMADYERDAWSDFVAKEIRPFGELPVYLGIGNHELFGGRTRGEFVAAFRPWLSQMTIHLQREADAERHIGSPGPTTWHFVHRGVDVIYLDNAGESAFTPAQLVWLARVLAADAKDPVVKTIVAGMHEALPFSKMRRHAMDASCQGICSGQQAYDLLWRAQAVGGKRVYLVASHAHEFLENVYDTPEHAGQVLPGWIVGTAGALQTAPTIRYGWLKMTVAPDGTVTPEFREVTRTSPPLAAGPGAEALTDFCFSRNIEKPGAGDAHKGDCACGAAAAR